MFLAEVVTLTVVNAAVLVGESNGSEHHDSGNEVHFGVIVVLFDRSWVRSFIYIYSPVI